MKRLLAVTIPLSMMVLSFAPAPADVLVFTANLDGAQEVPPNASPATGTSTVVLDTAANTVTVSLAFSGLVAPQNNCHIHGPAVPGVSAGVLVPLPMGNFVNFVAPITDTIEAHIIAGLTYINVHSTAFPGGEIRGQYVQNPVSVDQTTWGDVKALYRK